MLSEVFIIRTFYWWNPNMQWKPKLDKKEVFCVFPPFIPIGANLVLRTIGWIHFFNKSTVLFSSSLIVFMIKIHNILRSYKWINMINYDRSLRSNASWLSTFLIKLNKYESYINDQQFALLFYAFMSVELSFLFYQFLRWNSSWSLKSPASNPLLGSVN